MHLVSIQGIQILTPVADPGLSGLDPGSQIQNLVAIQGKYQSCEISISSREITISSRARPLCRSEMSETRSLAEPIAFRMMTLMTPIARMIAGALFRPT